DVAARITISEQIVSRDAVDGLPRAIAFVIIADLNGSATLDQMVLGIILVSGISARLVLDRVPIRIIMGAGAARSCVVVDLIALVEGQTLVSEGQRGGTEHDRRDRAISSVAHAVVGMCDRSGGGIVRAEQSLERQTIHSRQRR